MRVVGIPVLFLLLLASATAQNVPSAGVMGGSVFARQQYTLPSGKQETLWEQAGSVVFQADIPFGEWLSLTVQWTNSKLTSKRALPEDAWSPNDLVRYSDKIIQQDLWLMTVPVSLKISPLAGGFRPYGSAGGMLAVLSGNRSVVDERRTWSDDPDNLRYGYPEGIVVDRKTVCPGMTGAVGVEYVVSSTVSFLLEGVATKILSPLKSDRFTVLSWPNFHPAEHGSFSWTTTRYDIRAGITLH